MTEDVFAYPVAHHHVRPPEGKIQAGYLRGFKTAFSRLGGDYRRALDKFSFDLGSFESQEYLIDCEAAVNLLEYCSSYLDDRLFGFHLAEHQNPYVFGCASVLARTCPNLGEALQCLIDYV